MAIEEFPRALARCPTETLLAPPPTRIVSTPASGSMRIRAPVIAPSPIDTPLVAEPVTSASVPIATPFFARAKAPRGSAPNVPSALVFVLPIAIPPSASFDTSAYWPMATPRFPSVFAWEPMAIASNPVATASSLFFMSEFALK